MATKLDVKNLTVSFRTMNGKVQAVRNISFALDEGETLAIVGESGSGKSVTSKAIMGISAVNAMIESGQILYDGQDLTKITEEEFNKLRGNKISMIFQDPLSSLNPIMRIGNQLTEAMILKGKANQREARNNFNSHLNELKKQLFEYYNDDSEKKAFVKEMISKFDSFEILHTQIENKYNNALSFMTDALDKASYLAFKIEKKAADKLTNELNVVIKELKKSFNEYLISKDDVDFNRSLNSLRLNKFKAASKIRSKSYDDQTVKNVKKELEYIVDRLNTEISKEQYNFFCLAYFKKFGNGQELKGTITEKNAFLKEFIDKDFMNEFIKLAEIGMKFSKDKSIEKKKTLVAEIKSLREKHTANFDIQSFKTNFVTLKKKVIDAYDLMDIKYDNVERTFGITMDDTIQKYQEAVMTNHKEDLRFERDSIKYDKVHNKPKYHDWKVVPKSLIDIETIKDNMLSILDRLEIVYTKQIDRFSTYDFERYHKRAITLIDYFKEQASKFVYKVTKSIAKAKAIKLMEEVGIPEARDRYYRYPFEFSGGMRQRIVIAIALAADPDILICDEPTTALDVTIQSQILELINKIKKERNLSIIFITHDLGVVANMADKVAVMYAGKIVEIGTSEEIFYDPKHPYTWALLSSMPDLETNEKLEAIPGTPPNMIYPPVGDAFAARNKYAMKIDFEKQPPLFKITDTHFAATWLLHPEAPKISAPKIVLDRIKRMKEETKKFITSKGGTK